MSDPVSSVVSTVTSTAEGVSGREAGSNRCASCVLLRLLTIGNTWSTPNTSTLRPRRPSDPAQLTSERPSARRRSCARAPLADSARQPPTGQAHNRCDTCESSCVLTSARLRHQQHEQHDTFRFVYSVRKAESADRRDRLHSLRKKKVSKLRLTRHHLNSTLKSRSLPDRRTNISASPRCDVASLRRRPYSITDY